ncbi:MAG: 4Fe-4S dicluster domain-containing protein [Bacteroidetes bacterium]|nr:4Fe-4S dicluster domain-containing protein [Bacteroidota bacterium]
MVKINPRFGEELKKYGAFNFNSCYNCGSCTAVCSLSTEQDSFPREMVRFSILGMENDIKLSLKPWLCYYCGECTTYCPQTANPGELMMSLRRWLTAQYDWTGFSRKLYTSKYWEIGAILFIAILVLLAFVFFHGKMTTDLTPDGGVKLNSFAPWRIIELADWIVAGILSFFLLSNIFNMYLKIVLSRKDVKIPFKLYFTMLPSFIGHFATQHRFADCEIEKVSWYKKLKKGKYTYWLVHFLLMSSYVLLFTMIVGFLGWFQTDEIHAWYNPQRLLGYYATFGLIAGIIYFAVLRIKKSSEKSKKTHFTDFIFLVLLMLTAVTGILLHFFRINGMPYLTYYTYVIHLMILFPMLIIEVPFSKWSHLAYRPFAIYFSNLINAAGKIK